MVFLRVVLVLVHAHDDGNVFFLGRGGDDDLFGAVVTVHGGLRGLAEDARAFYHNVHVVVAPDELTGVALGKAVNVPVAHAHVRAVDGHVQVRAAIDGIVFQQVKIGFRIKQVVDGRHFHPVGIGLMQGAKHLPADAAKTVDAHFDLAHCCLLTICKENFVCRRHPSCGG